MLSMTGYGQASGKVGRGRLTAEIKSVNHRYCEVLVRLPSRMAALEIPLRKIVENAARRGKVEFYLKEAIPVSGGPRLRLDLRKAKEYRAAFQTLRRALRMGGEGDFLSLVGMAPFVEFHEEEENYSRHFARIQSVVRKALGKLERMRRIEGGHLLKDQKKRLKALLKHVRQAARRGEANLKSRQKKRGAALFASGEELAADKSDITEEIIRLESHAKQYGEVLKSREPGGRKLDFLIQEMHREVNTIGAKAADAFISRQIVECKTLLENLREQVQNIL